MYRVNGVELTSGQYQELKALVSVRDAGGDVRGAARGRLFPDFESNPIFPDETASEVYIGLDALGLVKGRSEYGLYWFERLTAAGIDFVHDYELEKKAAKEARRSEHRHDYFVAGLSALIGGALGIVGTLLGCVYG